MGLYDVKKKNNKLNKILGNIRNATTAINLGLNPKVAFTGYFTSQYNHFVNAATGQRYSFREWLQALYEVSLRVIRNGLGTRYIENRVSNDKMQLLLEQFDMMDMFDKKYHHSNRSRLLNAINNNKIFGFLSAQDYFSKAQIAVATVMSYRYVDGQFVTKEDIILSRKSLGESVYARKLDAWNKGKNLYSILSVKNGKLDIKDEQYRKAYEQVRPIVKARSQKYAEAADGMATDLQKAAITQGWAGTFILIHRQFMPLVIQERFGPRVYDYDTQQYKNGQFRTVFQVIRDLAFNNVILGTGASAAMGAAFFGPFGLLGGLLGIAMRYYGFKQQRAGKMEKKSIRDIFHEKFNDDSSEEAYVNTWLNRKNIKQVAIELLIYNLLITPTVNLICMWADDSDDDQWWKQMIAYVARSFQWESFTQYRFAEFMNAIKSPTAATSFTDKVGDWASTVTNQTINTLYPRGKFLFDPSQNYIEAVNDDYITTGAYSGWTKFQRSIFKATPAHNLFEQVKNAKAKRNYLENQIMKNRKVSENDPDIVKLFN